MGNNAKQSKPIPLTARPPQGERKASSPSCRGRRREDGRLRTGTPARREGEGNNMGTMKL